MEKQFNLSILAQDMKEKFNHDQAASTMAKCTKECFLSLKTSNLLPTEERCLRNCFVKSIDFQEFFENETRYFLRNQWITYIEDNNNDVLTNNMHFRQMWRECALFK